MKQLYENISGVVMAGGKSSRMGTDKGLLLFNGKPLVWQAINLLTNSLSEKYISTNNADYEQFGLKIIQDIYKDCGPIGGLHAVLKIIETDYVFVISCDMPFVDMSVLKKLVKNHKDYQITIPRVGSQIEPLCAIYAKSLLPEIEKRIELGNQKMYDLIQQANTNYIEFESNKLFFNINTKEDFSLLK